MANQNPQFVTTSGKSKITAGLLAIFLGSIGAHKFYLRKPALGLLYLVFFWTFLPGIIGIVEGLSMLLGSDESFNKKYNSNVSSISVAISPDTHIRCPECREFIFKDAKKCRYCGTSLQPQ